MEFLEVLTEGLERVLLVRGGGSEVITIYSWLDVCRTSGLKHQPATQKRVKRHEWGSVSSVGVAPKWQTVIGCSVSHHAVHTRPSLLFHLYSFLFSQGFSFHLHPAEIPQLSKSKEWWAVCVDLCESYSPVGEWLCCRRDQIFFFFFWSFGPLNGEGKKEVCSARGCEAVPLVRLRVAFCPECIGKAVVSSRSEPWMSTLTSK